MAEHPPADWYADPDDPAQLRYWDGTAWTELGLTDQNKPGIGTTLGTLPGGTAVSTAYDVALQQASLASGLGGTVTLVISTAGGDALQVVSDEDPNASRRPRLVLTFQ